MVRRLAVAAAFGLLAIFLTPGPAYAAAPGNGRCDANEVCLFEHERFGGGVADFKCNSNYCEFRSFTSWTFGNGHRLNDAVSSVKNRTGKWVTLFIDAPPDPGHPFSGVEPNGEWAVMGFDWNDYFSSMWISQ